MTWMMMKTMEIGEIGRIEVEHDAKYKPCMLIQFYYHIGIFLHYTGFCLPGRNI